MASIDELTTTRTLRLRLKDKHAKALRESAYWVNQVWNFDNELCVKVFERERKFMSAYDIHPFTAGASKAGIPLHSQTIQAVNECYVKSRKQAKKVKLRWRCSGGARRSLGWIPFKASALSYKNGQLWLSGIKEPLGLWDSYGLKDFKLGTGSLSEDSRGRWFVNVTVEVRKEPRSTSGKSVGIDLGLKSFAALSTGEDVAIRQHSRNLEPALAAAQRAGKKDRVRAIHVKAKNQRKDFQHKLSTRLVNEFGGIFIGDASSSKLAKTKMAKSIYDAGWAQFKTMLQYKSEGAGVWFEVVDESYSTQDCSACGSRCGPKGLKDLGIREWICSGCAAVHKRDSNSAKIILARGHARLGAGIPGLTA